LRPAGTSASSKDRWIEAYFISLSIPGKLVCPNKKEKYWYICGKTTN
jgi:hypothetical protein